MTAAFTRRGSPSRSVRPPRNGSTDWLWGSLGVSIASISVSFASYMIATAPSEVTGTGSKDFNVFVRFDQRTKSLADDTVGMGSDQWKRPQLVASGSQEIDLTPTGSIAPGLPAAVPIARAAPASTPLRGYVLRQVVGDRALIEHHNKLSLVTAGSILDDAGVVLAIQRRGDRWIVQTAGGVIGGS